VLYVFLIYLFLAPTTPTHPTYRHGPLYVHMPLRVLSARYCIGAYRHLTGLYWHHSGTKWTAYRVLLAPFRLYLSNNPTTYSHHSDTFQAPSDTIPARISVRSAACTSGTVFRLGNLTGAIRAQYHTALTLFWGHHSGSNQCSTGSAQD